MTLLLLLRTHRYASTYPFLPVGRVDAPSRQGSLEASGAATLDDPQRQGRLEAFGAKTLDEPTGRLPS